MAAPVAHQFAFRAQKKFALALSAPTYAEHPAFVPPAVEQTVRSFTYSADGRFVAYALPTTVQIVDAEAGTVTAELPVPGVQELQFSPNATFLSTWERPVKQEDGAQNRNHRIFALANGGAQVAGFTQKSLDAWDVQYTADETRAVRLQGGEVQVFDTADWARGTVDKARIEHCVSIAVSPGARPCVAMFIAPKHDTPASVRVHPLAALGVPPTTSKSFFKADRCALKWNAAGTHVLALAQTDVDAANKNYYGETGLYLLPAAGTVEAVRVALDKEGPVHDFAWSPNGKEFGVVYGFTPAKAVLFDVRAKPVHDFGAHPQNFVAFNPQGRLLVLAGFGNLAGRVTIVDRQSLKEVCGIDAPNTSHFAWSPCGTYFLAATLSPRLRVDNGIKIWHASGALVHAVPVEELYQAAWRPLARTPPFPATVPPAPAPSASVAANTPGAAGGAPAAPKAAYRPPGARGTATPTIYKREDEGGVAHAQGMYGRASPAPGQNGHSHHAHAGQNGRGAGPRARVVPGAGPPREREPGQGQGPGPGQGKKKKERKERAPRGEELPALDVSPVPAVAEAELEPETALSPGGDGGLDPVQKKIRNLTKKLKAIDELKEKARRGEKLEVTQVKKMDGEAEITRALEVLLREAGGAE